MVVAVLSGGCCCGVLAAFWVLLSPFLFPRPLFCSCALVVFCGLLIVFITRCFWANAPPPWLFVALQLDGSKRAGCSSRSDFASGCLPSTFSAAWAKAQPVLLVRTLYQMSIIGEVQITKMHCLQQFTQDNGLTEIHDLDCWISGSAQGTVHVRVSIHARIAAFDDEKWKLITLMCGHFAHPSNYTDIFAPSCGSMGTSLTLSMMKMAPLRSRRKCETLISR